MLCTAWMARIVQYHFSEQTEEKTWTEMKLFCKSTLENEYVYYV